MPSVVPCAPLHGADVRALRARLQLTRAQFAAVFQVSAPTVARWEGDTAPAAARRDVVEWMVRVAMLPPELFDALRTRVHQILAGGAWPAGWGIWTIAGAR